MPPPRMAAVQRKEPVAAAGRMPGQRQQADIQLGSQCRHGGQQCVGQLTNVPLPRDRGRERPVLFDLAGSNRP
jgi:hypothetical protein